MDLPWVIRNLLMIPDSGIPTHITRLEDEIPFGKAFDQGLWLLVSGRVNELYTYPVIFEDSGVLNRS